MMNETDMLHKPLDRMVEELPVIEDFLKTYGLAASNESFLQLINQLPETFWESKLVSAQGIADEFLDFVSGMEAVLTTQKIEMLEVLPGLDKSGIPEQCSLLMKPGEITCIVGPTGSGKSRLLADIEWLACADTPTKRSVLLNGTLPDEQMKQSFGGKLIAQITQNMNFVMDMDVESFLLLHAQSRFLEQADERVAEVIELANKLSGETFTPQTPVTFLSGGQSRALMIADVACIGQAPIVLIDEIENAGVDKKKALELLINQEKIVLMATHDPLLILQADRRVVIKNGGMNKIITTNENERAFYTELEAIDARMQKARNFFRQGNYIQNIENEIF
jgi:ABC-type lipoprotein export system ATPase subunit